MGLCCSRAVEGDERDRDDVVADGNGRWSEIKRRRRQSGKRRQAADAAAIDAAIAVVMAAERIGRGGSAMVANSGKRIERTLGGGTGGAKACKQGRQRDEISRRERDEARPPELPVEVFAHDRRR